MADRARVYRVEFEVPVVPPRVRVFWVEIEATVGGAQVWIDTPSGGPIAHGSVAAESFTSPSTYSASLPPGGFEFCSYGMAGTYSVLPVYEDAPSGGPTVQGSLAAESWEKTAPVVFDDDPVGGPTANGSLVEVFQGPTIYTDDVAGGPTVYGFCGEQWYTFIPPPSAPYPVPKVEVAWEVDSGAYALAYQTRARSLVPSVYLRMQEASGASTAAWSRYGSRPAAFSGTPTRRQAAPISDPAAYSVALGATGYLDATGLAELAEAAAASFVAWVNFPASAPGGGAVLCSFGSFELIDYGGYLGFTTNTAPIDVWGCTRPAQGWRLVVAVFTPGNSEADDAVIYIDGVWAGLLSRHGDAPTPANATLASTVYVGARSDGSKQANGYSIAEVEIVPYALALDQVAALWESRTEGAVPDTDPESWVWTNVTGDLVAWESTRGRQDVLGAVEPSEITLTLKNYDRRYEPEYEGSPNYPNVVPMRPVRATAKWANVTYPRWFGAIGDVPLDWENNRHGITELPIIDEYGRIARKPPVKLWLPSGQRSGDRVHMVLDALSVPDNRRSVATGMAILGALDTTTSPMDGAELLQRIADSERGAVFVDDSGVMVFHDRATRQVAPYTTAAATWGDGGFPEMGELPLTDLKPSYGATKIRNVIVLTTIYDGVTVTVRDHESIRANDELSLELADLQTQTVEQLNDYAAALLEEWKDPHVRFDSLDTEGRREADAHWPALLDREFGDRIAVVRRPGGDDDTAMGKEAYIEQLAELVEFGQSKTWKTRWQLSPAGEIGDVQVGVWILDTSMLGIDTKLGF